MRTATRSAAIGMVLVAVTALSGCGPAAGSRASLKAAGRPASPAVPAARGAAGTSGPPPSTVPTLVYGNARGVALVGVAPVSAGSLGAGPAVLYLGTGGGRWSNVTPPRSRASTDGVHGVFEQASFLDASTGWVTDWNPATTAVSIYRTDDRGRSWTRTPGGSHSADAGAASLIDLVNPTTAFEEQLEPAAPRTTLTVTTDAGRSWKTVYREPAGTPPGRPQHGPLLMPVTFADPHHGFAASGLRASDPAASPGFFATSDGGSTWVRQHPPMPAGATCPASGASPTTTACGYGPAGFVGRHGRLAAVAVTGRHAVVALDVTGDEGRHWRRAAQVTLPVTPGDGTPGFPLTSVTAGSSWALGWAGTTATVAVLVGGADRWDSRRGSLPVGMPTGLTALSATRALLTMQQPTPSGTVTRLFATSDAGTTWAAPALP